ncbi:sulfatase [Rugamonas sp.]|uniref:sulfatase family protein n=1 Tax=Rugamonas sp. TaxID=1926287 RepID=UPI0025DA8504|nr:sulfatase [Rugamonas sp.]
MDNKITRRQALARTSVALGGALLGGLATSLARAAAAGTPLNRPNILFMLADDWSWQGSESTDQLGLRMPTLARMQRAGVTFENAFVASPTCTASRGAILSGRWPWRLEEGANLASILPQHFPLYTDLLESSGYYVGMTRKGWAPGQLGPAGRKRNPAGNAYSDFNTFLYKRPADRPFCFWFGSDDPHRPYNKGIGIKSGIDPATITVPPYLPDTPEVRSDIADYRYSLERFDLEAGLLLDRLERDGELANTLVIMTGDNGWPFPRGKATLYDAGSHVPLVAMYPAKIPGGRVSKALISTVDLAATFLDVAGVAKPASMDSQTLMPLLAAGGDGPRRFVLAGRERHMDGAEVPLQAYASRSIRTAQYLYIRNFFPERWPAGAPGHRPVTRQQLENDFFAAYPDIDYGPTKAVMVLGQDDQKIAPLLKLATGKRPPAELYDVAADPYQLSNLMGQPQLKAVVAQLDQALLAELRRTGDPRVGKPGDIFDHYPSYSDPGFGRPDDF